MPGSKTASDFVSEARNVSRKQIPNIKADFEAVRDPGKEETAVGDRPFQQPATLVTWDGPNDPENPKNWTRGRKWRTVIAISGFVLRSPLSTTIVAPSLDVIAKEMNITIAALKPMILSIFMLGFAFGPLFISPLSEIFGRTRVLQFFNMGYFAFNTACGALQTATQILVLRFLSGVFGSASVGIGAGALGDMFQAHERGKALAMYSVAPLIGLVLGPIAGGFLTQHASWRWAFYMTSIIDAVVQVLSRYFLEESYTPVLLRRKKERLMKAGAINLYTEHDFPTESMIEVLKMNMIRPLELLATQPVVQVLALYQGYLYGNIYIIYAYFPTLWTGPYEQRLDIASLNYLSLGIGTAFAAQVTTHVNNRIYRFFTDRNGGRGCPESRVHIIIPATILLAVGLFWYGWSAQKHFHWIMPNIGVTIFSASAYVCTLSNNTYMVDTYGWYSASALASISMLRCFGFSLFSPYLYEALDYGGQTAFLVLLHLELVYQLFCFR